MLLLPLALAQEPPDDQVFVGEEILVTAELGLAEARGELDRALAELGYGSGVRLGDRTVHLNKKLWKPSVVVHDWGHVAVRGRSVTPLFLTLAPITLHGVFGSPRMARQQESRVHAELEDELADWRSSLATMGHLMRLEQVLAELEALEAQPAALKARMAEIVAGCADSPEGDDVRALVLRFARSVGQPLGDTGLSTDPRALR